MFTGIVETVGTVTSVRPERGGLALAVKAAFGSGPLVLGESIAVSGPCLTVEHILPDGFECFASGETLSRTKFRNLGPGARVNLERALSSGSRLGGHMVLGHIDGVGRVREVLRAGDAREVRIEAPVDLFAFIASKGSIAVDGVSLTVNRVARPLFSVTLVPHTLERTTLKDLFTGAVVNLEVDMVARYVVAFLRNRDGLVDKLQSIGMLDEE